MPPESQPLSNGALPPGSMPIEKAEGLNLDQAIEKSKAEINAAATAPKRGRGRPRKVQPGQEPTSMSAPGSSQAAPAPPVDYSPYLKQAIQTPANFFATKYKCPELRVSDQEAEGPVAAANQCLRVFMPGIEAANPKTAAVYALVLSVGMLTMSKYAIFSELQTSRAPIDLKPATAAPIATEPAPTTPPEPPTEAPQATQGGVSALQAYRRPDRSY